MHSVEFIVGTDARNKPNEKQDIFSSTKNKLGIERKDFNVWKFSFFDLHKNTILQNYDTFDVTWPVPIYELIDVRKILNTYVLLYNKATTFFSPLFISYLYLFLYL